MKQSIKFISLFVVMAFILIVSTSQTEQQQPKKLTVSMTRDYWVALNKALTQSNAPHQEVVIVQDEILRQLNDSTLQIKIENKLK